MNLWRFIDWEYESVVAPPRYMNDPSCGCSIGWFVLGYEWELTILIEYVIEYEWKVLLPLTGDEYP